LLLQASQCFIAIQDHEVIAFARVLTDEGMIGSIWDVVVDKKYQGAGVCSALMNEIFSYPAFNKIKKWILFTETAGELYTKFGFQPIGTEGQVFYNPLLSHYVVFL
jgi:predicted GNAT family acetyltransferase